MPESPLPTPVSPENTDYRHDAGQAEYSCRGALPIAAVGISVKQGQYAPGSDTDQDEQPENSFQYFFHHSLRDKPGKQVSLVHLPVRIVEGIFMRDCLKIRKENSELKGFKKTKRL